MATLDGLTLHAQVNELKRLLTGGRIDKISQPDRDEIHIIVRNGGTNHRLLICARPDSCRVQLTDIKKTNPTDAPMFCMLLRKHLTGGRIVSVTQQSADRIVRIETESTDELYNTNKYTLICELMGRHSNIILTNADNIIIESIKRIGISISQDRPVLPGCTYELPQTEVKSDPFSASEQAIRNILDRSGRVDKLLLGTYYGVAPVVVMYLTEKAGVSEHTDSMTPDDKTHFAKVMHDMLSDLNTNERVYLVRQGEKEAFLPFEPSCGDFSTYDSPSAMLDHYYETRDRREYMRRRSYSLTKAVENKLARSTNKLAGFDEAIAHESDFDRLRIFGELVCANVYRISAGQKSVTVENYYENPVQTVEIPLDESLSGTKNSQKYFKLYKKAKGARDKAIEMREGVLAEIEYLQGVEDCIRRADSEDALAEIRAELEENRYVRREQTKRNKKLKKQPPQTFISTDGYEIYVGRNNYQNDELTFHIASPNDLWLHVKDRPGSHTVIINKNRTEIPQSTIYEAAVLAAQNSSAGEGGAKIEVDYTLCRYVKKPAGALPGKVIYTNQRTILVVPSI